MKNIKHYILLLATTLSLLGVNAQVGLGNSSPAAQLDISASNQAAPANNDGILIPRINTFPATNPTSLQQGMLVFLTTIAGANQPGFYYWNNPTTAWIGIGNNLNANWTLLGNSGTSAATNFIGTTTDMDLVIKRNNVRAGYIGDPGLVNPTTGNKNTSFGARSLNAGTTGTRNAAFGTNVMPSNSSGFFNVAMGDQTMYLNTTGAENTAIGTGALYSNVQGSCNVALGRNALTSTNGSFGFDGSNNTGVGYVSMRSNTTGAFNSALGRESLFNNASGYYNTGVGYQSLFSNTTGASNVALGNQAGYFETGSNKLYIENSNANAVNALIYGDFGSSPKILRTNSQFQISDPATTGYKFPTSRGANKQTLETDATGNLSWVTANNSFSLARTNLNANQALTTAGWQKIAFNTVLFDTNTEFVTGSNRFVASKAGYYQINAGFHTDNQGNNNQYSIGVYVNGVNYQQTTENHYPNGIVAKNINCVVNLAAGGYVEIYIENYQPGVNIDFYSGKTFFEIIQIK